ncbi:hypothetical protein Tco_0385262 [Tanacetum coccineum]
MVVYPSIVELKTVYGLAVDFEIRTSAIGTTWQCHKDKTSVIVKGRSIGDLKLSEKYLYRELNRKDLITNMKIRFLS